MRKPAKPDDLKLISGVGPKLEGVLNDLGIYKYEQVAKWKKAERDWVDTYLKFKGRIERDDWVKQAKALAKGGEAEYIKVFGKKPRQPIGAIQRRAKGPVAGERPASGCRYSGVPTLQELHSDGICSQLGYCPQLLWHKRLPK
eukprot:TRINITY_DN16393_c1_g1_i1.p1 TRINITY_DN16393_c1_g1~~TRINITY_DN16393_c1_g1_i1.p1  ORF type:complete len:154 (-),score=21.11 TRINITY_DN16393_c1_g1_i1:36-464(-)